MYLTNLCAMIPMQADSKVSARKLSMSAVFFLGSIVTNLTRFRPQADDAMCDWSAQSNDYESDYDSAA